MVALISSISNLSSLTGVLGRAAGEMNLATI